MEGPKLNKVKGFSIAKLHKKSRMETKVVGIGQKNKGFDEKWYNKANN